MIAFGMKGAALAAFGEIPADFLTAALFPLGDRKEGVKLGESTFNTFFDCLQCEGKPTKPKTRIWTVLYPSF